ncbi:hypothetical protein [Nonomuraea indica]|uniref:hypothetical protein n=1 Tax=Nonomuraea indica TaxID=1581193 RepID=UPI000C79BB2C|nr:hypothetical protein [Nonomuraea indica]
MTDAVGPEPEPEPDSEDDETEDSGREVPDQDSEEEPDEVDDGALHQSATVINNFLGHTDASGSIFGVGRRAAVHATTRAIEGAEIDALLRRYVEPEGFRDAHDTLLRDHLVTLVGPEDIGKRLGAIALLSRTPLADRRITVFSPARSLVDLATQTIFKPGRAYLIHDWSADGVDAAISRFELSRLSEKLVRVGAYLVLTRTGTPRRTSRTESAWRAPDPGELFDIAAGPSLAGRTEQDIAPARARAIELRSPAEIIALVERLAAGDRSVADVLAEDEGSEVADWFDDKPRREDLMLVAALSFAYGVPERVFEQELARLSVMRREHDGDPAVPPASDEEPQTRAAWRDGHPLVTTCVEGIGGSRERRVIFRGARHRERVIEELAARYGFGLWEPLRAWIRTLVHADFELHIQAAAGVALLARVALPEVNEEFLDGWADGQATERLAAANVLSLMCADDTLAPEALKMTLSWVTDAGQSRAMTAAIALSGGLSVRYPTDALNWLWHLTLRGQRISDMARRSLELLFRQAGERGHEAVTVLRVLVRLATAELGVTGTRSTRVAFGAVVDTLAATRLDGVEPLAAHVLATQPAAAKPLGRLWALVLRSSHHRGQAIESLRRALAALDGETAVLPAVMELGTILWAALPPEHDALIRECLRHALIDGGDPRLGRRLVQTLLTAGNRRAPSRL